jgi:CheY-like chemotaxis protein/anti-sigma regulatory factor (Ser/Thr protein kinase)
MSHILVVDDSPVDRALVGQLLELETDYHVEYASDGSEALEHLEAKLPVAVLADLQMPVMDGMQLVKVMHKQYPNVPVILMTAFGSEDIALEALLVGAADYVPKSRLTSDLVEAIKSVLALTVSDRPHKRLAQCMLREEIQYELDNDLLLIPPLVEQLQNIALDMGLIDPACQRRFARSITEALRNAIYHGNLELPFDHIRPMDRNAAASQRFLAERLQRDPYGKRRVHVLAQFTRQEVSITVRDEGPGFDFSKLPDVQVVPSLLCEGEGRGLVLMRMFMDEVRIKPPGNEITLVKRARDTAEG